MTPFKFLHSADLHLGHSNFGIEGRVADFAAQLPKIRDIAVAEQVRLVILAGDVFESPDPDPFSAQAFREFAEQLEDLKIDLVAVAGNHDRHALDIAGLDRVTRVESIHRNVNRGLSCDGKLLTAPLPGSPAKRLRMAALDWMPSTKIPSALQELPQDLDVLVMHQSCTGFLPAVAVCEMQLEWLAGKARYVALGDLHISKELRVSDNTVAAYPGPTEMNKLDERQTKSVNVVTLDLDDRTAAPAITKVPLSTREVITLKVDCAEDLSELRAWAPANPQALVVFKYSQEFEREVKQISSAMIAGGQVAFGTEQSLPKAVATETFAANQESAGMEMAELLQARFSDDPLLGSAAVDLWNNPDNSNEILNQLELNAA